MSLVRTRHTWLVGVFLLGGFATVWACLYAASTLRWPHHAPGASVFLPWVVYAAVSLWLSKRYEGTWHTREGAVRADEHGLYLNDRLVLTRRALRHGHLMQEGERMYLRLHRRAPFAAPYDVEVADEAEARRLLAALRLDAQTSVSEFELRWGSEQRARRLRWGKGLAGTIAFLAPLFLLHRIGEGMAIPLWFASCLLISYLVSSNVVQITVGADGLHLKRTYTRSRFIAYADVKEVRLWERTLVIELADGSNMMLHRQDEGPALEERIREALSLHRARNANAAAAVNRGGRTIAEWLEATKERRATYREAAVPSEELWSIIEDAAASPTERAGAALSLRKELDAEGKNRPRIAAGACAEKKLRIALESVAGEAGDEALEEVLEPLEDRRRKQL